MAVEIGIRAFTASSNNGHGKIHAPGQKLVRMGGKFKVRQGEWRRRHRSWWEKYPAWVVISLLLTAFFVWMAGRKIAP